MLLLRLLLMLLRLLLILLMLLRLLLSLPMLSITWSFMEHKEASSSCESISCCCTCCN